VVDGLVDLLAEHPLDLFAEVTHQPAEELLDLSALDLGESLLDAFVDE
jgi:hypothetical protein